MLNLNDREWKAFLISDVCTIESGQDIYDSERTSGDIPYITSSAINNGVKFFVSNSNETLEDNAISVNRNGSVGYCFYHKYKALYSNDCRKLKLKEHRNENAALFITNQISLQKDKYNYGYKMGTGRLLKQKIMLPIDQNGQPDYVFMENYIKERKEIKRKEYLDYCTDHIAKLNGSTALDIHDADWKEFQIGKLFHVKRPASRSEKNYLQGDIPFVASGNFNNGVTKCCKTTANESLDRGNCITVSPVDGSSFYQKPDFLGRGGAGSSIFILYNDSINQYSGLFISQMIHQTCAKYCYGKMGNKDSINRERIMLPVDNEGNPNYLFMEEYVKNIMLEKYHSYIEYCKNDPFK